MKTRPVEPEWPNEIPPEQWDVYGRVIREAKARGLRFAVGGGFGIAAYTGHLRSTKDLDLYVLPADREAIIAVLRESGLRDYFEVAPYDRNWIYRSHSGDIILDVMWSMPNQRAEVDERWITAGPELIIHGERLRPLPPEEMIWAKLYVMQRDRCDWPDVLNLLHATGRKLDWKHLLARIGADAPLLRGLLAIYAWLSPERALSFPASVWRQLNLPPPEKARVRSRKQPHPEDLLDSREWFYRTSRNGTDPQ